MSRLYLTVDEYATQIETFLEMSRQANDEWQLNKVDNDKAETWYMHRTTTVAIPALQALATTDCSTSLPERTINKQTGHGDSNDYNDIDRNVLEKAAVNIDNHSINDDIGYEEILLDDTDNSCLETHSSLCCRFEHHVVYSLSYQTPVLYFNCYLPDGRLMNVEELWELVPKCYYEDVQRNAWATLSQGEHPLLNRPFYFLHPCHTATLMAQVYMQKTAVHGNHKPGVQGC